MIKTGISKDARILTEYSVLTSPSISNRLKSKKRKIA